MFINSTVASAISTIIHQGILSSDYAGEDHFLYGGNEMKEECEFFGIRKNPDPDHVPKIKHEQIMSRFDAELLEWICTTGYDEAMKEWEEE